MLASTATSMMALSLSFISFNSVLMRLSHCCFATERGIKFSCSMQAFWKVIWFINASVSISNGSPFTSINHTGGVELYLRRLATLAPDTAAPIPNLRVRHRSLLQWELMGESLHLYAYSLRSSCLATMFTSLSGSGGERYSMLYFRISACQLSGKALRR